MTTASRVVRRRARAGPVAWDVMPPVWGVALAGRAQARTSVSIASKGVTSSNGSTRAARGEPLTRAAKAVPARSMRSPSRPASTLPQSSVAAKTATGATSGAEVGEQRPQRVVEGERVPGRAAGGAEQHRRAAQRVLVEHVEERLEQPAVRRGEDRRRRR